MPPQPKTSRSEMLELFKLIVAEKIEDKEENDEEIPEKILITTNKMKYLYIEKLDIELSRPTLRNYGFCKDGYFENKYSDVFTYRHEGQRKYRGMVIDINNFIDEIGVEQ